MTLSRTLRYSGQHSGPGAPRITQIFAGGGEAEAARNRDQIERLHRLLGDLEAEVEAEQRLNKSSRQFEAREGDDADGKHGEHGQHEGPHATGRDPPEADRCAQRTQRRCQ